VKNVVRRLWPIGAFCFFVAACSDHASAEPFDATCDDVHGSFCVSSSDDEPSLSSSGKNGCGGHHADSDDDDGWIQRNLQEIVFDGAWDIRGSVHRRYHGSCPRDCRHSTLELIYHRDARLLAGLEAWGCITSPYWVPRDFVDDRWAVDREFPPYPYCDVPGYMTTRCELREPIIDLPGSNHYWEWAQRRLRRYSVRLRADYATDFGDLTRLGGHLLVSTTSRWGLDTEINYLREDLPGGGHDDMWTGDCNLVFRFAQSAHMQWRTGIGLNFLDDRQDSDFGFNFTYGADWFPVQPWVLSATIDWGRLGADEQFRVRTTAGIVLCRVESYVGYEYYDWNRTQLNTLIGGVRYWF